MAVSQEDIAYVTDLFSGLGTISTRKMMGGLTIYADGQVFAILTQSGTLMIKAKDTLAADLATEGSHQFSHTSAKTGKTSTMSYWSLPDSALDDPEEATRWARKSLLLFA